MARLIQQAHELHLLKHGGSSRKDIASHLHVRPALSYVRISGVFLTVTIKLPVKSSRCCAVRQFAQMRM
jgi:hypothetical protein